MSASLQRDTPVVIACRRTRANQPGQRLSSSGLVSSPQEDLAGELHIRAVRRKESDVCVQQQFHSMQDPELERIHAGGSWTAPVTRYCADLRQSSLALQGWDARNISMLNQSFRLSRLGFVASGLMVLGNSQALGLQNQISNSD